MGTVPLLRDEEAASAALARHLEGSHARMRAAIEASRAAEERHESAGEGA